MLPIVRATQPKVERDGARVVEVILLGVHLRVPQRHDRLSSLWSRVQASVSNLELVTRTDSHAV